MAAYYWLPFRCDTVWAPYFTHAQKGALRNMKHLPYMPVNGRWDRDSERYWSEDDRGEWSQVRATDTVKIVTHGRKFSTKEVAWLCQDLPAGLISWTAPEMAAVMKQLTNHVQGPLEWDLLACFGANMWGLSKSFASRLHEEMLKLGMKGKLTAYQGATNIGNGQGRQTGSGRFTTGFYMATHKGHTDKQGKLSSELAKTWVL
jgi:hypothetical protein